MREITASGSIFNVTSALKKEGKSIGLVPTMGALHEGHFTLVRESTKVNDVTVVSIFVNPLQFNKKEDLLAYPRNLEQDLEMLESLNVDYAFTPGEKDLYPSEPSLSIRFGELENVLEGAFRPGHFAGVGVVVSKLFHIVQPDRAYFGLKDLQQFLLIKKMCVELNFPLEVMGVDTVREASGLAMSSRNLRLSEQGKAVAAKLYQGLQKARRSIEKREPVGEVVRSVMDFYNEIPELEMEYFEVVDGSTLRSVEDYEHSELAVCLAAYVEGVRLIDNLYLQLEQGTSN